MRACEPRNRLSWLAAGEPDLPADLDWLSSREREYVDSLRFTKRRTEFLIRRLAGKRAVAAYVGLSPADISRVQILNHPSGAPYALIDEAPCSLDISVTDRAGWAVAFVRETGDGPSAGTLGVDLELAEPRSDGFFEDFLTATERTWVRSHRDRADQDAAANLVWSAKEAALKVLRVGLRADTRSVEVTIKQVSRSDGWGELSVAHGAGESFPGWWRRDGDFLLTFATLARTQPPEPLEGCRDLAHSAPTHSWVNQPVVNIQH